MHSFTDVMTTIAFKMDIQTIKVNQKDKTQRQNMYAATLENKFAGILNKSLHYKRTLKKALALQGLQINQNFITATICTSS